MMFKKSLVVFYIIIGITIHSSFAQVEANITKGIFDKAIPLKNGLILVKKGSSYGCIDVAQKVIIPIEYEFIGNFINDLAVVKKNKKLGVITANNTTVIAPIYDEISSFTDQPDYFRVKQKDLFGLIDKTGKFVLPMEYDEIGLFYKDNLLGEGLTTISKNGKYGYANLQGSIVIPMQFDSGDYFSDGLALVKLNNKQFFINTVGATVFVVPSKYHFVDSFSEGRARVSTNDHFGYIDKTGKLVIPMEYQMAWGI
ncbi:WG repeat-containing protein [Flavobacterium sp. SUN046]|nr:WG repeat-containing protein [Flavobacterium sp. SUN046]